jgi:predicted MFS family arabinose efflux permease
MRVGAREIAVAAAGFCAFLNLYSPQALLPALSREFGVGPAEISAIMTASTLAIALTAPFTGALADVLGRKRVITTAMVAVVVPMAGAALAADVPALIAWRFLQGLLLPPIFAVVVAYIGDEWPSAQVANTAGIYFVGSSLGGLSGRFIPGVLGDLVGWRPAFLALAGLSLAGAITVILLLPPETKFVRSQGLTASSLQMLRHLGNRQLLSTYGIGFGVLFNYIAVFTYVSFHLAAPPFSFSSTLLGAIFVTYLIGTLLAPVTGRCLRGLACSRSCSRYRGLGIRLPDHVRPLGGRNHRRADRLRRLRHGVPDRRNKLCHDHCPGGPLLGRRSIRDCILCWRQHGCLSAGACLEFRWLARMHRHGHCHACRHGIDCRTGLRKA